MPRHQRRLKLPQHFTLTISGNLHEIGKRTMVDHGEELKHVLYQILRGVEFPETIFRAYGITLYVEEDTDQGDEPPQGN